MTICVLGLAWLSAGPTWRSSFLSSEPQTDYYNLLVDGFLDGHLWMKAEVDPRVARREPTAIAEGAHYLLDASLYEGHYYLYFGPLPAVLVLLPFTVLTGHDLPSGTAVLLFVLGGFAFQVATYRAARRQAFPGLGGFCNASFILLLGFGTGTPYLLTVANFYELAVAGGYFCLSAALWALFRAWHQPERATRWLAVASLATGLAVASRPVFLFALPAVFAMAALRARALRGATGPGTSAGRSAWLAPLFAAVVPAAIVGVALAAYNYGRFDDPLEFGIRYQMNAASHLPVARAAFVWPNLKWYFLTPPTLSPFFPFVFPIDATVRPADYYGHELITGHWLATILGAALVAVAFLGRRRLTAPARSLARWLLLPAGIFTAIAVCVSTFGYRANRYTVDFQTPLVLALALLGGIVLTAGGRPWFLRLGAGCIALVATLVALTDVLGGLHLRQQWNLAGPPGAKAIAFSANQLSHALHRAGWLDYGPVRLSVRFDATTEPVSIRPLLATGTTDYADIVNVTRNPGNQVQFSIEHRGYGGLTSESLIVEPGATHEIEIDLGSLYPPRNHPYFRGWAIADVDKLRTTARIAVDGREILRGRIAFYEDMAHRLRIGQGPLPGGAALAASIVSVTRLPPRDVRTTEWLNETGIWCLDVTIPYHLPNLVHPVLGSGITGAGNMLQLRVGEDRRVQFSLDAWGVGLATSPWIAAPEGPRHVLEIFVGSRVAEAGAFVPTAAQAEALAAQRGTMRIWVDGEPVWTLPLSAFANSYDFVSVGSNPQGFSLAIAFYGGELKRLEPTPEELREFVERNLALPAAK